MATKFLRRSALGLFCVTAIIFCMCGEADVTGPSGSELPPPSTMAAPAGDVLLPRVDAPFSWNSFHGFTAFALGHPAQTELDIRLLYGEAMMHGRNTGRICSETEFWDLSQPYLYSKPRDIIRLKWLLDIIASIPGAQVLLIGDCTLKGPVPEYKSRNWARAVASLAAEYENIAIETHNEFKSCPGRGWVPHCPTRSDVAVHVQIYRAAGLEFVTVNQAVCKPDLENGTLRFRLFGIGVWPADFHPCRDWPRGSKVPWDPDLRFLRELVTVNGMTLLSETVALGDVTGVCSGLRTCDHDRIQRFVDDCGRVDEENSGEGCKFVFHSERLLGGDPPDWWPTPSPLYSVGA